MIRITCKDCGKEHNNYNFRLVETDCEGCKLALKRLNFEDRWVNGGGFMSSLCRLITISDSGNLKKLYKAYPDLVEGYIIYSQGMSYDEWVKR